MTAPRRSDARRNRAAIMKVVGSSVVHGLRVPSAPRIAHLTGLGQATVYRHFPDRRSLLLAVTEERLDVLRRAAKRGAGDPGAFHALLRAVMVEQVTMRPTVEELRRLPAADRRDWLRRLLDALRGPFALARAAGHLRCHVELDDVAVVLTMLQAAVESAPTPDAARRAIPVLLDGLFNRRGQEGSGETSPAAIGNASRAASTSPASSPSGRASGAVCQA
ncbi:TetR/AcrR family transcriptional regulator [Saccharothrix syringae]|uniref:TetR/AcrR family transcriptional regulator n=1 Tax=Saccharothrix syringae TaxID=103733 RepID=A0A5Q0H6B8_SACSY|nr:TetR/AcrR family transcriptional regulator [Saccharothrix syringae]QFZ21523.1 TetR/AcrR family transcriptional regulator [Saccharothrix syringae]